MLSIEECRRHLGDRLTDKQVEDFRDALCVLVEPLLDEYIRGVNVLNELLNKLQAVDLPKGKFAIFGSGPMAVRGLKEPHDLDVIVPKDLWDEFKRKGGWIEKQGDIDPYLENKEGGVELWHEWRKGEWDVPALIAEAEMIDGWPYVKLEHVLTWKRLNGRPKDLEDAKTIENYLKRDRKI